MTEAEWFACDNPARMLAALPGKPSQRRWRLIALACCQRGVGSVPDTRIRDAIQVAEMDADGACADGALEVAHDIMREEAESPMPIRTWDWGDMEYADWVGANAVVVICSPVMTLATVASALEWARSNPGYTTTTEAEGAAQCHLIREVFGNPLRPAPFDPSWRTSTVTALAQQMYESRDFGAMPILADALQDASCTSNDILAHCRDLKQVHVRGCWVVDLVLGKE